MSDQNILTEVHGDGARRCALIRLNRPAQLNALNDALMDELGAALTGFDADDAIGCIAILGIDMQFYEKLPYLFPHANARSWFAGQSDEQLYPGALRNSSLQGAYLIVAARALGLDCGPMGGFDAAKVDAAFFAETPVRSNFLINLGYGRRDTLHPRSPRLAFADACSIV